MKCKLRFLKDYFLENNKGDRYYIHHKNDVVEYDTWDYLYGGEDSTNRENKGMFVICNGHGNFDVFYKDKDVEIVND